MYKFMLGIMNLLEINKDNLRNTAEKVTEILKTIVGPICIAIGGAAAIYCIVLGVQFAKAEDDGKRAEIKKRIWNCLIGIIVILILVTLTMAIDWAAIVTQLFGYTAE